MYNIATHYEYEDKRGVAMLSTMGRAMGGQDKFKEMSPFHILENSSSSSSNEDNNNNNNNNNNRWRVPGDVFIHLGRRYRRPHAEV